MLSVEVADGRVLLRRKPAERQKLLSRLRRVEGQVRGVADMIEQDRYCGDELQQLNAAVAALREVAVLLATEHVEAASRAALEMEDPDVALRDVVAVLRAALRVA